MSISGPLNGVTVIDLTRVLAGPYCTMVLADLGARVIKVEAPGQGDDARAFGPFLQGRSAYFLSLNRGKESIALDLKAQADREVFLQLLEKADVLIENFRPGTMEKLGYGWPMLHALFPRLILASTSGFGQTGPYSKRPAYDMVVQAMGGIMSLTGHKGGPPTRVGTSVGDITAGLFTAVGINAALFRRTASGEGARIDIAMLDCQIAILENAIARYFATGQVPEPMGARHPSITPFEALATKDGHIVVAAGNDQLFRRLCDALEIASLADNPLFLTNELRTRHHAALKDELEAALAARNTGDWLQRIEQAGVPCGPINDMAAALNDPHVLSRNMVVHAHDPVAGAVRMAGNPIKIEGYPDPLERPGAPALDGDGAAIRRELGRST
jgi:CoA:oxalate CoA-transferase